MNMVTRRALETLCLVPLLAALGACGQARSAASGDVPVCETCHGQPPTTGAHLVHVEGGVLGKHFGCEQCHADVQAVNQPDHILRADGTPLPPPAEVRFDDPATLATAAAYDGAARTCSNVYCHGAFRGGNFVPPLPWTGKADTSCGTCHNIPPPAPAHPILTAQNCGECHPGYNATPGSREGTTNATLHVNGSIDRQ
ncbi:MAG: hypothetical protein A2V77_03145 [Anaeromyxobacter sp. RBG_16_69_14]|nr:MAG: hypothetical protein A2V77_03145 [Anaeromyxobacter sp. RBG_16_69_14]